MPRFGSLRQSRDQPFGRSGQPPASRLGRAPRRPLPGRAAARPASRSTGPARRRRSARTPGAARRGAVTAYRAAQHRYRASRASRTARWVTGPATSSWTSLPIRRGSSDGPGARRGSRQHVDFHRRHGRQVRTIGAHASPPSVSRRPARVVAAHDVPVLLHEQRLEPRRVRRNAVHAMPDLASRSGICSECSPRLIGCQDLPPPSVRPGLTRRRSARSARIGRQVDQS